MADRKLKNGTFTVRNTSPGVRGFYDAETGYAELEPGQSASGVRMFETEYASMERTAAFEMTAGDAPEPKETDDLAGKSQAELEKIMTTEGVTMPTKGSGKNGSVVKADLEAAIKSARENPNADPVANTAAGDTLDKMSDADLRETVKVLTGSEPAADADRDALLKLARGEA